MQEELKKTEMDPALKPKDIILENLRERFFLHPDGSNTQVLIDYVRLAVEAVIQGQGSGPLYPINNGRKSLAQILSGSEIPLKNTSDPTGIMSHLPENLQGSVKANSPYMVKNIIAPPSFIHLATHLAVSLYMPNGVTGEDAAEVLNAEIACAAAIAKLAGYSPEQSAGVFTFGGTGTNLYAFKIGLTKTNPDHRMRGLRNSNVVIIGSKSAHYSHQTACDWLGIGQENYLQVESNLDQTTKLDQLESRCREALAEGKHLACIEAVGGTTSNMAIDDIEAIYNMRERLIVEFELPYSPHIHVDAVIGWVYLNFINYDFQENSLGFNGEVLQKIRKIVERISKLSFADSFGVDFHKTGYAPYISSMLMVKDDKDLAMLRRNCDIMTPLFHDGQAYNPGTFTLETSRSAANILATSMTLQTLGQEGYQVLLGHSLEVSEDIKAEIANHEKDGLLVVNKEAFGCDVFVRCYPPGIPPNETYKGELNDDRELMINTEYTNRFAKWLFVNKSHGDEGIALSKTSAAFYTHTGCPVVALRIYPLNPFITPESASILIEKLVKAKMEFDCL